MSGGVYYPEPVTAGLMNSSAVVNLKQHLGYLSKEQVKDVIKLVEKHSVLFKDNLDLTHLLTYCM